MAAIDKIYVKDWNQYIQFKEWCEKQPRMIDKYGNTESICKYVYLYNEQIEDGLEFPILNAPYFIDAYIIRNCPFEFIQDYYKNITYRESYNDIKEGKEFSSPITNLNYEIGKHFKCIKHPEKFYNKPFLSKVWWIDIILPESLKTYMWYHENTNTWDFMDEYVISDWSSSTAHCKTIKALKRLIRKWKLPIGTIIDVTGRYLGDEYQFIVTK